MSLGFRPSLTPRLGAGTSLAGARANQLALELGEAAEDGEHQATVGRGGVGPCVAERAEAGLLAGNRCEGVEKVAGRAREAVEPRPVSIEQNSCSSGAAMTQFLILCPAALVTMNRGVPHTYADIS